MSQKTISNYLDSGLRFHNYIFNYIPIINVIYKNITNYDLVLWGFNLLSFINSG